MTKCKPSAVHARTESHRNWLCSFGVIALIDMRTNDDEIISSLAELFPSKQMHDDCHSGANNRGPVISLRAAWCSLTLPLSLCSVCFASLPIWLQTARLQRPARLCLCADMRDCVSSTLRQTSFLLSPEVRSNEARPALFSPSDEPESIRLARSVILESHLTQT